MSIHQMNSCQSPWGFGPYGLGLACPSSQGGSGGVMGYGLLSIPNPLEDADRAGSSPETCWNDESVDFLERLAARTLQPAAAAAAAASHPAAAAISKPVTLSSSLQNVPATAAAAAIALSEARAAAYSGLSPPPTLFPVPPLLTKEKSKVQGGTSIHPLVPMTDLVAHHIESKGELKIKEEVIGHSDLKIRRRRREESDEEYVGGKENRAKKARGGSKQSTRKFSLQAQATSSLTERVAIPTMAAAASDSSGDSSIEAYVEPSAKEVKQKREREQSRIYRSRVRQRHLNLERENVEQKRTIEEQQQTIGKQAETIRQLQMRLAGQMLAQTTTVKVKKESAATNA